MRAYLDSCIAIYLVESVSPWAEMVEALLAELGDVEIVVSDLVRMECRVLPVRNRDAYLLRQFDGFFRTNVPVRLTASAFERATEMRATHRLQTPDALHVACAREQNCDEFWTNDNRLAQVAMPLAVRVFA